MEKKIQQEYLRLLNEGKKVRGEAQKEFENYQTLLSQNWDKKLNPKTRNYEILKEIREKLLKYMATITMGEADVHQLTYPDYNQVASAVRTALQNVANDIDAKDFCEFMRAFETPALTLIKKQEHLFDNEDIKDLYSLLKGLRCFSDCISGYLPKSADKDSMTFALYAVLDKVEGTFKAKELYYLYMASADKNKILHIKDKYKEFLEIVSGDNRRLSNAIKSTYKEGFDPEILLLEDKKEQEKFINKPGNNLGDRALDSLEKLIPSFFDDVRKVLLSDNLPDLVNGPNQWLHRLERQEVKVVPFEVDEGLSLAGKFERALEQAAEYLKHKDGKAVDYGKVMEELLKDGVKLEDISGSKDKEERPRQILCDFVQRKKIKSKTYKDLEFSSELKSQIEKAVEENRHNPKDDLVECLGIKREQIFYLMSIAFSFRGGNKTQALTDVGPTSKNLRLLKKSLNNLLFPASKDIILADVEERVRKDKSKGGFMKDVVEAALNSDPDIEQVGDGLYQLKKEALDSAYLIQGRIMYEINDWRSKEEILQIYRQQFPEGKKGFMGSFLSKFVSKVSPTMGFISLGKKGKWRFTEDKNKNEEGVIELLEKYLQKKEVVTIDEVMNLIKEKNMPYEQGTIRTYLYGMCYVDETGTTFVLFDKKDDHPEYSWKRKYRGDSTNWTINRAVEILQKQPDHKMEYKQFRNELMHFAKEEGYRSAVINIIKSYDGEDKLFVRKDGFIELNLNVLEKTDLKFEGLYRKDPHFMEIFSYTFNALSHKEDGQLALTELIERITKQTDIVISESAVRHAFDKDAILPDGLERISVEGRVYIRLVDTGANDDEQYKVDVTAPVTNEDTPSLVIDTTERPVVTYQTKFKWDELRKMMKLELAYYDAWDVDNRIISESSLDKFQRFMEGSEKSNLNEMIPQDMYENWYANINRFAKYHYFADLALNFEGLLKDIIERNGKEVAGRGFVEICQEYYPEYYNAIFDRDSIGNRYGKILKYLHHNRNQISHGDANPAEMISIHISQNILNYIALYIRTVVKYYNG